jgi:hypothetical protein
MGLRSDNAMIADWASRALIQLKERNDREVFSERAVAGLPRASLRKKVRAGGTCLPPARSFQRVPVRLTQRPLGGFPL